MIHLTCQTAAPFRIAGPIGTAPGRSGLAECSALRPGENCPAVLQARVRRRRRARFSRGRVRCDARRLRDRRSRAIVISVSVVPRDDVEDRRRLRAAPARPRGDLHGPRSAAALRNGQDSDRAREACATSRHHRRGGRRWCPRRRGAAAPGPVSVDRTRSLQTE